MTIRARSPLFFLFTLTALLSACSGDSTERKIEGERIAVLQPARRTVMDAQMADPASMSLPEPAIIADWPQSGGTPTHRMDHHALGDTLSRVWSSDIGSGSDKSYKLLATPVIARSTVYTMDSRGSVSAFSAVDGDRLWTQDTTPEKADSDAIGGGIAFDQDMIYATTGFGEVLALRAQDGAIVWRRSVEKPLRAAPTVADGRVFVIDIENTTHAIDTKTGLILWHHKGIAENATLLGASSPAVNDATVVVAYSSGELFGLRSQNGRVVWSEVLSMARKTGALPAIADIRGLPVINDGRVYAISHSGRSIALAERTGNRLWDADVGGINTPAVTGNVLYTVTLRNELVAMDRQSGGIIWTKQLAQREDDEDRDSDPVTWWGPVLANGRLWLTNSLGELVAFSAMNGSESFKDEYASSFSLPPVVADKTLYLLSDSGDLMALR